MATESDYRRAKSSSAARIVSVPAALLWGGVGAFMLKWASAWQGGRLQPGIETSWMALYVIFGVAALAICGGACLTAMAWLGKSTVRWQAVSLVVGVFFLWLVAGD